MKRKIGLILIIIGTLIVVGVPAYTVTSFMINLGKSSMGIIGGAGVPTLKLCLSMAWRSMFTLPFLFGGVIIVVGCVMSKKN